jgi:hypothetical protein
MPKLQNDSHEAFARARALGARLEDAYEDAGYVASCAHASRLAARPEVAARIAELRRERSSNADTSPQAVVDALFRMARDSETLKTAAGLKEARAALLEAHRLSTEMTKGRSHERLMIERELRTGA